MILLTYRIGVNLMGLPCIILHELNIFHELLYNVPGRNPAHKLRTSSINHRHFNHRHK